MFSTDGIQSRDIFAREASIANEPPNQRKFFLFDLCRFDLIRSMLFYLNHKINSISLISSTTRTGGDKYQYYRTEYKQNISTTENPQEKKRKRK